LSHWLTRHSPSIFSPRGPARIEQFQRLFDHRAHVAAGGRHAVTVSQAASMAASSCAVIVVSPRWIARCGGACGQA
jgi:hypothetical protein